MPCRDARDDEYPAELYRENKKLEAFLCGILRVTGVEVFDSINYEQGGFKRKHLEFWWMEHQKEDARRLKLEQQRREKEELKKSALSKLTIEEAAALGIK